MEKTENIGAESLKIRIGFIVARLKDHSQTVMGVLVKQDIKAGIDLILELYAEHERNCKINDEELDSVYQKGYDQAMKELKEQIKQLKQERNKALDEAIELIPKQWNAYATLRDIITTLESLKRAAGVIDNQDFLNERRKNTL